MGFLNVPYGTADGEIVSLVNGLLEARYGNIRQWEQTDVSLAAHEALHHPETDAFFLKLPDDVYRYAAALLFYIARARVFAGQNRKTALMAALLALTSGGVKLTSTPEIDARLARLAISAEAPDAAVDGIADELRALFPQCGAPRAKGRYGEVER